MKIRFILCGAIIACCHVNAEENVQKEALTFEEAVIAAYNNNKGWRANQTDKKMAEEAFIQSKMSFLPSIGGKVSSARSGSQSVQTQKNFFGQTVTSRESTKSTQTSLGITVTQNLFNGFATINRVKASDNAAKAADNKLKFEEQRLIIQVLNAYTSIWVGRQKVAALKKKEDNLKKTMDSNNTSLEAGAGTPSELAQAKANYSKSVYERIEAETELFTFEADFEKLTSLKLNNRDIKLPDLKIELPKSLDNLIARAMTTNRNILARKFEEHAEFDNLKVAKAALSPSCDLMLSSGRSLTKQDYNNSQNSFSASIEVTVPIFSNSISQGNSYSAIEIANQRALKAKFTAEDTMLETKKECVDNWNKYISAEAMIKASRSAVKSAQLSTESNIEENAMGTKSNTEILVQENQLLDAKINFANSRKQRVVSAMTILALSGDLNLQTLFKKK